MANTLKIVLRKPLTCNLFLRAHNIGLASIYVQDTRYLYSRSALGLDRFEQQRERVKVQMSNISDKFREKMVEYSKDETKNIIFTEDLKNMVHLAENDKDIELAINMLKRYNQQNKSLRFGNYIFGPVVMRMFYLHNKVDLALECFKSEEFSSVFDQQISFQIMLDMLFENEHYKAMLEVVELIAEKQLEGQKYPKNVVVLALAACYKLNNAESLNYALTFWSKLSEVGHVPMRRATTFLAGLAFNQGKPDIALEVLASARNQNYTTVRNLKLAALAEIGRVEEVIPILKSVLNEDVPNKDDTVLQTFNYDVIERVKKAVQCRDDPELTLEFNRLEQALRQQQHLLDKPLEEQLLAEIQNPRLMTSERDFRQFDESRRPRRDFEQRPREFRERRPRQGWSRPGLVDLV
ncbi:pentatricopeptide repeat-containing protein 2, mitochondrial-like [Euwallacea fornicatus]|uniref:pentatricopeptide repeat-containing protein 2, mitochondrial-like n=1 Tax=Euwallacea fornicatus TaxID=995702 RepID=UPI00338E0132